MGSSLSKYSNISMTIFMSFKAKFKIGIQLRRGIQPLKVEKVNCFDFSTIKILVPQIRNIWQSANYIDVSYDYKYSILNRFSFIKKNMIQKLTALFLLYCPK